MLGISLEKLLRSPGQIRVLRVLWRAGNPLTGRQVQNLSGLANLAAMQALKKLTDLGVVSCRKAGRSNQYELKRSHWAVLNIVSPIFEAENNALDHLSMLIVDYLQDHCISGYLYGSAISRTAERVGDVDLFLLVKSKKDKLLLESGPLVELANKLSETFNLFLEPNIYSRNEMSRRTVRKLAREVVKSGQKIFGLDLRDCLK
ncbi:MAG: hypothetical protein P9M00_02705 [Candidatus Tritonobacter lacicola]|nr:hypothetical protein [Candidatus Tritonobacter lacicola]